MSKHTSGPWTVDPGQGDYMGAILGASGVPVCTFGYCTTYYPAFLLRQVPVEGEPPTDADARLIASAPDLLEALQGLVLPINNKAHNAARAAIAKATGGEA